MDRSRSNQDAWSDSGQKLDQDVLKFTCFHGYLCFLATSADLRSRARSHALQMQLMIYVFPKM